MSGNKKNEIVFHNERYKDGQDSRSKFEKFYLVTINSQNFFKNLIRKKCKKTNTQKQIKLLDYGCGIDAHGKLGSIKKSNTPEKIYDFYNSLEVNFTGIDISPEAIKIAKKNSKENNLDAKYLEMDAEKTTFPSATFDIIIGKGILHHLSFDKCIPELSRLIKENGSCIFFEPLGHNPIINLGRLLTPGSRTKDEHPILQKDFKFFKKYFKVVNFHYFCCFNLIAFLFYKTSKFRNILSFLTKIDEKIFSIFPFLQKYSWIVVIEFENPIISKPKN